MEMKIDVNELLNPIQPLIEMPLEQIDQTVGNYTNDETPCCVGAHMANLLDVSQNAPRDFLNGVDAWISLVYGNRAHAILMLRHAGAGKKPLSTEKWPLEPSKVFDNLRAIEKLPSLAGVFFEDEMLFRVNFKGMDLSGTEFKNCLLHDANFESCNLQKTSFVSSDLEYVQFRHADLTDADLRNTDLRNAYFAGATLKNVSFTDADLDGAVFDGAKLIGVDTKADNFSDINLGVADVTE